eukprot:9397-Heterococcus_DN1.PRE.2
MGLPSVLTGVAVLALVLTVHEALAFTPSGAAAGHQLAAGITASHQLQRTPHVRAVGQQPQRRRRRTCMSTIQQDDRASYDSGSKAGRAMSLAVVRDNSSEPSSGSSSLAVNKSFERVLDSLGDADKYNAVLQGLAGLALTNKGSGRFPEVLQLLDEMHANGIKCSDRSSAAVIDAAAASADVSVVADALSRLRRAGAARKFSRDMPRLSQLPSNERQRAKALQGLVPLPADERGTDISYAGAFMGVVGLDFAGDSLAPVLHMDATLPAVLSIATAGAVAFDLLKGGAGYSRKILAGMNRLFLRDVDREARAEAAAFLVAYLSGLPCFAFQPNVVEALRMVEAEPDLQAAVANGSGAHRTLVWLLAAAAGEGLAHRQLIASDPRQAATFLQLALDKGLIQQSSVIAEQQQADVLLWAFNEARELLKEHSAVFEALRKRLETGGATVGECVSLIEKHRG